MADAEPSFRAEVRRLLDSGAKRICDVGAGAIPIVGSKQVRARNLDYVLFDISQAELDKAPPGYTQYVGDILDRNAVAGILGHGGSFDGVLSCWTAEHMVDGRVFHQHVFELLRPGGTAVHFFPTLYALPFMVNRVLSHKTSSALLFRTFRNRKVKFPAYYSWCRGPTRRQIRMLEDLGYSIERYSGFFGHTFYARVKPLHSAHMAASQALVKHPHPTLTSFAVVVLRRPG